MSSCGVIIKEEISDETLPMTDVKERGVTNVFCNISSSVITIKQEIADETESTFPLTGIKQEGVSTFFYGGPIHVKQEGELIVPDEGSKHSSCQANKIKQYGSESTINNDSKECVTSNTADNSHSFPGEYKEVESAHLKKHLTILNTGEKFRECPHCDYKTGRIDHLKKHIMARHTSERPQKCPHCLFKTVEISNLKKHIMARHTGEKPYKCPRCDFKAVHPSNLKVHVMARHTSDKPHKCLECDFKTVNATHLKNHIIDHHTGERPRQDR